MTDTPIDYAIEFGHHLANAAENFMREQNRVAETGETIDAEAWRALESAVYEFRKRADRADALTGMFRRLGANQRRRSAP